MISAMRDIDLELLDQTQRLGNETRDRIKGRTIRQGAEMIAKGLDKGLSLPACMKRWNQFLKENRSARTEIVSTEDPKAMLGIFYCFASIIHTGNLPEQVRR
jgi:hypothetical protein